MLRQNNADLPLALSQQTSNRKGAAESLKLFVANFHPRMITERMYVQVLLFESSFKRFATNVSTKSANSVPSHEVEDNTGRQNSDHEPNGCVARRRDFYESGAEMLSVEEVDQNKGGIGKNPLLQADNSSWQIPTNSGEHLRDDWDLNAERIFNKHRFANWSSNSKSTLCTVSCSLYVVEDPSIRPSMESSSNDLANAKHPSADLLPQSVADLPGTGTPSAIVHIGSVQQQSGASIEPKEEAFSLILHSPMEDGMAPPAEALNQRLPVFIQQQSCSNFPFWIGNIKQNFRPPPEAPHKRPSRSGMEIRPWAYACLRRKNKLVVRGDSFNRSVFVPSNAMPGGYFNVRW